jgi:extracellular solute-binding protein
VITAPPATLDGLIKKGKTIAESKIALARSSTCVAVRAGAAKPDISSVEAFKNTLLNAKSITYLPVPGVPQLLERLGIKDAIAGKAVIPKTRQLLTRLLQYCFALNSKTAALCLRRCFPRQPSGHWA